MHRRIEIAYPHLCESKDATWDTEHPLDLKGTKYAAVVQWACTVSENCRDAFEVLAQLDSEHKLAYQVKKKQNGFHLLGNKKLINTIAGFCMCASTPLPGYKKSKH